MNITLTNADFDTLMALTKPFDEQFPAVRVHLDRLFYHLTARIEGERVCSFGEFHQIANRRRAARETNPQPKTAFQLGLIGLVLAEQLKRVAAGFPDLDMHCDRVMFEIIREIGRMEPAGQGFDSLKTSHANFRSLHLDHRMRRRVLNSEVKGVG